MDSVATGAIWPGGVRKGDRPDQGREGGGNFSRGRTQSGRALTTAKSGHRCDRLADRLPRGAGVHQRDVRCAAERRPMASIQARDREVRVAVKVSGWTFAGQGRHETILSIRQSNGDRTYCRARKRSTPERGGRRECGDTDETDGRHSQGWV